MRAFDASSIVYAWDHYPLDQFPRLWDWINTEIKVGHVVMSDVAVEEVEHVAPTCAAWLKAVPIEVVGTTGAVLARAQVIAHELGIVDGAFHVDGVDETDLIIVATCAENSWSLTSNESVQNARPENMKRYRIPAVCRLESVSVDCGSFLDYLKGSRQVF